MFRVFRKVLCIAGVVSFCALPTSAHAWTDASVQTVRANVEIDSHASAHVTLVAKVRVHGGWLTDFEIDGLDPDLDLDGQGAPWAVDEAGATYTPNITRVADGRVRISFERRNAPRRGACEIGFHYRTELGHRATSPSNEGETIRVRWTLPAWQTGLDGVILTVRVPGRAIDAYDDDEERDAASVQRSYDDGATTLVYRRVHLPRTTPWMLQIDTPREALDASLGHTRMARATTHHEEGPTWPIRLGLALVLLMLGIAKERISTRARGKVRATLRMPPLVRAALAIAAIVVAATSPRSDLLVPSLALMGLVLLGLVAHDGDMQKKSFFRTHFGLSALMDLSTALGALCFVGLCVAAFYVASLHSLQVANARELVRTLPLLAWPLFVTATRFSHARHEELERSTS